MSSKYWFVCLIQCFRTGRVITQNCPVPSCWDNSLSQSVLSSAWGGFFPACFPPCAPAFLPGSQGGRCCSFFLRTPSFQLHTESISLHTSQSSVSSDKPSSQLHNLFSHPSSSLQRRHRQEKSAKVHANRSLFLLCLLPAEFLMFPFMPATESA